MSQLVAVRSGSAFLEQLRRVTPQGVQLRSVSVDASGTTLTMEGVAQSPEAFERLNAFGLNLEDLPAVSAGGAVVQRATADETGLLQFTVKVSLDLGVAPTAEQLIDLGADGLARRYQLLEAAGDAAMTNLRNGASPALLSRDRILVGAPLLIGVALAMGVGFGVLRPTLERGDALEARLADLQRQQRKFACAGTPIG